jgi:hypothetical protein
MSPDELVNVLSENATLVAGLIAAFAVATIVVFGRRGFRRIEARLDTLRAEVSALRAVEERNFLIALRASSEPNGRANKTEPSIVPEIADLQSENANSPDCFQGMTTQDMELARKLAGTGEYRADSRSPKWFGYALANHLHIAVSHGAGNDPKGLGRLQGIIKTWLKNKTLVTEERKDDVGRNRKFIVPGEFEPSSDRNQDLTGDNRR